jgi:hypothetical protein
MIQKIVNSLIFVLFYHVCVAELTTAGFVKSARGQVLKSKEHKIVLNMFNYTKSKNH